MTRRIGRKAISGGGAFAVVAAEVTAAVALFRTFTSSGAAREGGTAYDVIAVMIAVVVGLLGLQTWSVVVVRIRRSRDQRSEADRTTWSNRWIDVMFGEAAAPTGPLPHLAVESLLDLRESLAGEPGDAVGSLMREYGVETSLIERLQRIEGSDHGARSVITPRIATGRTMRRRLEVLDELGRARTPRAVPALLAVAADPEPITRQAGIRALARSAAAIGSAAERRAVALELLPVIRDARLSMGGLGEALELLGPVAPYVVAPILQRPHRYGNRMLIAAIDTVGRLRINELGGEVARFAISRRDGVRLAALHALTKLERLPTTASAAIQEAVRDREPGVRIEAARGAKLLETKTAIYVLEELLCDEDWRVRRVAATTLAQLAGPGIRTLIATSLVHGDTRARSIATQVLLESRSNAELELEPEKVG